MICCLHPLLQFSSLCLMPQHQSLDPESMLRQKGDEEIQKCPKNLKIYKPQTALEQTETAGGEPE